ncbi:VOC family protein [Schinkia azotoformans]|uniref:VOC family protein n=1 Tax=Schinkia azotoformans TaxID=1454 RepID=UPI002DBDDB7E|nr:VOC family protein [Schinkia azotoformans]MEC1720127.1 VOC family protein [Schinkia azotoformans]MED4414158.1 VOC family protein [Schinkia azotoformans]
MALNVYMIFNGECRQAVEFYGQVFGSEARIMSFGDAPPNPEFPMPEEAKNLVMHAELMISGSRVMFSDSFPGRPYVKGNNIELAIVSTDMDEVKSIFNQLKEGGKVEMELQETFWSKCYGKLTDKFGVEWQVSHDDGSAHQGK